MMVHEKCISNKTMSTEDQGMQEKGPKSQITKGSGNLIGISGQLPC